MKFPFFAVFAHTIIIVETIGEVGILLNLSNQGTRTDGVNRTCFNKEQVVLLDGNALEITQQSAVCDGLPDFGLGAIMFQAVDQVGVLGGIQHIPHLALAVLAIFVLHGVGVIGMYLHRQVLFGIDELDQQGKLTVGMASAQIFWMLSQNLGQGLTCKFPTGHHTGTVRMGGTLPGFSQRVKIDSLGKLVVEASAAPQIVFGGGFQQEGFKIRSHISVCHRR